MLTLVVAGPAQATPTKPGFTEEVVFSGLTEPTNLAFASDGRVFVAEKSGLIKVYASLTATTPTIVADLRTQVHNFWDRGLLGMVLDPQFPQRPYLYVLYTYDAAIGAAAPRWGVPGATSDGCPTPPGATADGCVVSGRLSRLTLSGNTMTSEKVLLEDWCQQFPSHSIGALAFGSDGALYVSGGEGASFNYTDYGQTKNPCGDPPVPAGGTPTPPTAQGGALRSQDLRTTVDPTGLSGTLLRVDPDTGDGLADNPLAASADPNLRRIVAAGFRNPFRFTMRPGTSEIYVGDVGWADWEEIDKVPRANDALLDNFGWPCYEGNGRQPSYDSLDLTICEDLYAQAGAVSPPLFTYRHGASVVSGESCAANGSSISGLAFYPGGSYPAAYTGALIFADYSRECVWSMLTRNGTPDPSTVDTFANSDDTVDLKVGPGGDIYLVNLSGTVKRIRYPSNNHPPTAVAHATPTGGPVPLTVNFDATQSSDPDPNDTLSYAWDLNGDGIYDDSTAAQPTRTYTTAGAVTVRLRVTDSGGASSTDSILISPGNDPPRASIDAPSATLRWTVGDTIQFSGSGTDPQDGVIPPSRRSWRLLLQHCTAPDACHVHPLQNFDGVAGGSFTAPDHEYPSYLELQLTVTDSDGLTDTATLRLDPKTVNLTFHTDPAGLKLAVGPAEATTPFTRTVIPGSTNSVSAPTPQALDATAYRFSAWSDGGARSHDIVAPEADASYTALYVVDPTPPGLVAAYGFNETSGTTVADASVNGNTGIVNGPLPTSGRYGGGLSFDGVNDFVTVPASASLGLTNGMTLEAWVRPSVLSGWRTVVLKERDTTGHVYALYASDGTRPVGEVFTTAYFGAPAGAALPVNQWSHLAATFDGTTLRLYVNGTQATATAASGTMTATSNPLKIGGNAIWGEWFSGVIDEVRLYDRALSAAEIQTDMNTAVAPDTVRPGTPANLIATGGLGQVRLAWDPSGDNVGVTGYEVHRSATSGFTPSAATRIATVSGASYTDNGLAAGTYFYRVIALDAAGNQSLPSAEAGATATADTTPPTVSLTAPANGASVAGSVSVMASASDNAGVAGVQFQLDGANLGAEDAAAPYAVTWNTVSTPNGSHRLTAIARDAAGNRATSAEVTVTVNNPPPSASGLVAAYGFNETTGTTATDASGSGNTGTLSNATRTTGGRYGGALSFNGTNARVNVSNSSSLALTNAMTLEAWVRPSALSGWRTVILKERGTAGHVYALYASDGTRPIGEVFTGSYIGAPGGAALALNTWAHLALTFDGTTLRLYVNGTQVSATAATGAMAATTNALRIGGNAVWGEWFAGLIDEVRIYRRVLSAAEIQADMNQPV